MRNLYVKGKFVLVLLLCFMIFGITNVYAEESINEVSITGIKSPVIGDKVSDIITDIKVLEGANYTIDNIMWWESENGMYFGNMVDDSVFQDNYSYYYSISLKPNDGYAFAADENGEYTGSVSTDLDYIDVYLNNDGNLEVVGENIIFGDLTYKVIEGANQTYVIGESTEVKFVIDADYELFEEEGRIYVDEDFVDPANYTASEGSTVITLKKEYVDTLSEGEHTFFAIFSNYKYAETTFNVTKDSSNTNTTSEITPPNTGIDYKNTENYNLLYISVLILSLEIRKIINTRKKVNE